MIFDSILDTIGNTPLVKLNRVGEALECNLFAKCEFFNPGGSIKDRIAARMVLEAEKQGRITPGDTLIEPTSGNTGIGLALAGAVRGYNVIVTMPEKMSREKQVVMEALGTQIIRTPTEAAWDSEESHIAMAKKLQRELPNAHILDQYSNEDNPEAHYSGTAEEILNDLNGKVDMLVVGAGTGGTITGCARRIKESCPDCIIVGVDPVGSILAGDSPVGTYKVEGIGYDFLPDVLNRGLVDKWVKTNDPQSFLIARRLIKEEGLLCGGACGAAVFGALQESSILKKNDNCVVILPDGVRNYLSKFIDDHWMKENRFATKSTLKGKVGDFLDPKSEAKVVCMQSEQSIAQAISTMKENGFSQIPIVDKDKLCGILHERELLDHLMSSEKKDLKKPVRMVMRRNVTSVNKNTPMIALEEIAAQNGSVVLVDENRKPIKVITKIDMVEWIALHQAEEM